MGKIPALIRPLRNMKKEKKKNNVADIISSIFFVSFIRCTLLIKPDL
jgi:hypothetical protein